MSYSKEQIYNLALSALLLEEEVTNIDTTSSSVVKVLNTHYDIALNHTLEDLDLDSTSQRVQLELIKTLTASDIDDEWSYVYKYPANCALLRRVWSGYKVDNKATHIPKVVRLYNGTKSIFTNEASAEADIVPNDFSLSNLSYSAGLALAYNLARLSAPLIVGKGAAKLKDKLEVAYTLAKAEAQEHDAKENFNYEADYSRSEYVYARMS